MERRRETRCIHGEAHRFKDGLGAISVPVYQTASFRHTEPGHNGSGFDYTRESNPTRQYLEETIASLEGAAGAVAFSSGMAAVAACFELLRPGDEVICSDDLYGGTVRLLRDVCGKNGVAVTYADTTDLAKLRAAVSGATRAIYVETPGNPMMRITDIRACAALAHEAGALLMVDNTFLSPYWQNPLALGADIVLHSGTKFLAGHNDTIAGFLCAADQPLCDRLRLIAKTVGNTLAPFDAWLVLRGLKTLHVRMERQQENARKIAAWLRAHDAVTEVLYPGLPEHPGYEINRRQSRGAGSMISFRVDTPETARRVLERVRLVIFAESLGGVESLLTYPLTQTHADVPAGIRERLGITDTLLRLSVGLEHADDIIEDLRQALEG